VKPTVTTNIAKWKNNNWQMEKDLVVREDVVAVYFNEQELVRLHCSPDHVDELVVGYLKASGLVKQKSDITNLKVIAEENTVYVSALGSFTTATSYDPISVTTGCGQGPAFYHCWQGDPLLSPVTSTVKLSPKEILSLVRELHGQSELFKLTGGVHSAALGDTQGLMSFRQDIGRHNAVDKVIGNCILENITTEDKALIVSGRISSDIIFKAALSKFPLVVSPSAPTHLAIDLARRLGVTVVGFARGTRLSVYSEVWRLQKE